MSRYCILFNPKAGNNNGTDAALKLKDLYPGDELRFEDMTGVTDYASFFSSLSGDETLILAGGDGTLNRFVNDTDGLRGDRPVWYYPTGSGNDFWNDLDLKPGGRPAEISRYLARLPRVTVKGETRLFINGIGYGIDGYCCEVGDELRKKTDKPINYTSIALKGLLFHYHPTDAEVTVDGEKHRYTRVWLAPTMMGRFFGGGMMPTPNQRRLNPEGTVSCMVMHDGRRFSTLLMFPSIFKGNHLRYTKKVSTFQGKEVTVRFNRPTALQIDGETVLNVTEYSVRSWNA